MPTYYEIVLDSPPFVPMRTICPACAEPCDQAELAAYHNRCENCAIGNLRASTPRPEKYRLAVPRKGGVRG